MYKLIGLFVLGTFLLAEAEYQHCTPSIGDWDKVHISGCKSTDEQCLLRQGTDVTIEMDFKTYKPIKEIYPHAYAYAFGIPAAFRVRNPELTCVHSNDPNVPTTCTYKNTFFSVKHHYPRISIDIELRLVNENNETIACLMVPAKIVKKIRRKN